MTYHLLRILLKVAAHMPFWLLYGVADVLFVLLYYVVRYRRAVVRRNLTECFPEKPLPEIKRIERRFYRNFADQLAETCKMSGMSPEQMGRRMRFVNVDEVNKSLREHRSVALFLGHYGNWEWVSSMPLHLEKSALPAQIYHKLRNESFDRIMSGNRAVFGATSVDMYKTARFIKQLGDEGICSIIGFIADQSPKWRELHYYLPFLNHDTPVLTGTEKIVKHFGFEAWFLDVRKLRRGFYEARFVRMHPQPKALKDFELTDLYFKMLEDMIRRDPELYLWTHNRFKHARRLNEQISAQKDEN
ncbi:MAG: lysophospholipid acyltransferase family protein [Muribaculaceae bacterium]|nr:lysophospholipid acyltransferase family protein [Muribaculaceae bacterium]